MVLQKKDRTELQIIIKLKNCGNKWTKKICSYERYFQLLVLVKTKSPVNFLWVSFVEGLHRHAATILALLSTKFDYHNKIQTCSLSIQDFKAAKIPHFVDPKISLEEQIKLIMNGKESLAMLKNTYC
jgi:hypothetical protein